MTKRQPRPIIRTFAFVLALGVLAGCAPTSGDDRPTPPRETREPAAPIPADPPKPPSEAEKAAATVALRDATAAADLAGVRSAILHGADLEATGEAGRTPLVSATKANQVEIARALLEAGADPNAQDDMRDSAFLYAGPRA